MFLFSAPTTVWNFILEIKFVTNYIKYAKVNARNVIFRCPNKKGGVER